MNTHSNNWNAGNILSVNLRRFSKDPKDVLKTITESWNELRSNHFYHTNIIETILFGFFSTC